MKLNDSSMPKYNDLMWPTLNALDSLGGSGTIQEIEARVYEAEGYSEELLAVL